MQGCLAVSRAIGDVNYKPYVSAEPEIVVKKIEKDKDMFIVLASDGLWDVMTNEEVARYVYRNVVLRATDFKLIARELCREALIRGSCDNITCQIVCLRHK